MRRLLRERFRKFKRAPKATSSPPLQPATITVFDYLEDRLGEKSIDNVDDILPSLSKGTPTWIDVSGDQPISVIQRLAEIFELHPLTLEDILSKDQRPKVESFENYMYIAIQKPSFDIEKGRVEVQQVSIILTPTNVLSIHEKVPSPISPIRWRMHSEVDRIRKLGSDYLAYVIVDATVDEYFVIMENCEDRIQETDAKLSIKPEAGTIEEIHLMRQEIIMLRRSIWPLRDVIATLSKTKSPLFDEGIKVYLKDLEDHIFQIVELIEVYRDMITGMQNIYLSTVSNQMNEVMKTLTMIASIFIPLTLITGCYGMNFIDMPELHWAYGYPMVLGIMIVLGFSMFLFFKRKGWL